MVRKPITSQVLSPTLLQIYCIGLIGPVSYSIWVQATICDPTVGKKKKSDILAKKKGKKVMSVVGKNKNQLQLVTYPLLSNYCENNIKMIIFKFILARFKQNFMVRVFKYLFQRSQNKFCKKFFIYRKTICQVRGFI